MTNPKPAKKTRPKKKQNSGVSNHRLDDVRLGGTAKLVPKGFKPFGLRNMATEQDVIDFLTSASEAGDVDAQYLLKVLEKFTVNDLIVEGVIRLQKD